MATYCYMTNRMTSLPLTTDRKETEWQKILSIAENNKFPFHHITKLKRYTQHKTHMDKTHDKNKKWAIFTFHSPKVRKITNLFKQTDIKIASKSTNKIQQQTRPRNHGMTPDHNKSGIYKLKCKTCNKAYIGQTSRSLSLRCREHIRYIKTMTPPIDLCTAYPTKHPRIWHPCRHYDTIKTITRTAKLIPYEQLFIQTFHHNGDFIDEQSATEHNPLFHLAKST